MKYLKTFESFSQINEEEEIFKEIGEFFSGLVSKVKDKFKSWRDSKKKAAVEKIATLIDQKKNDPKVIEMIQKIQAEYDKLNDTDKKQLAYLQTNEASIDKLGDDLDKAGIELTTEANESAIFESLITQSKGIATILRLVISLIGFLGAGYVTSFLVGAGISTGLFIVCAFMGLVAMGILLAAEIKTGRELDELERKNR